MSFRPRRGSSFFLRSNKSTYAFGIVLSSKSDEDDEYKILRTEFSESPASALKCPLTHTDMFDFEDSDFYSVLEWDKEIVKSLSRRQLFGRSLEVQMLTYNQEKPKTSEEDTTPSEIPSVDDILEDAV